MTFNYSEDHLPTRYTYLKETEHEQLRTKLVDMADLQGEK
jgi:hypothetical protein